MDNFRSLLLEIGQDLKQDDVESLIFACPFIPAGRAENIKSALDLFKELERLSKLAHNNRQLLAEKLVQIGRNDLRSKLLQIPDEPPPQQQPLHSPIPKILTQKVTSKVVSDLNLAEKISINWKFLGRYLGLPNYILRNIEDTYRRTEQRSNEMLVKWQQSSSDTSVHTLMVALKKTGRTDLAEELEAYCKRNTAFPDMADLGANLPPVEQPIQGNQTLPREHHERQEGGQTVTDAPGASGVSYIDQEEKEPVQVSGDQQAEDLKQPGNFSDEKLYKIVDVIGSGGFSRVYLVTEVSTNKEFAVKTVDLGLRDKITKERVDALQKEVSMLRVLENPYISKYYKMEEFQDLVGVVMEYMPGGSIAGRMINEGPFEETTVRKFTWQLLNGLQYLHANRVIHCDVKGANILLDLKYENVKLTDFGISIALEGIATSTGHCVSNQQGLVASLFWTSPEMLGSEKYNFNTDIWSLGCTVVEMLTGHPPLRNDGLKPVQVMCKITNNQVSAPDDCSSCAKIFLDQCFLPRDERPSASDLLEQGDDAFPMASSD